MNPQSIPMTAWEQAVIVVIFAVFIGALLTGMLNWFGRQNKLTQDYFAKRDSQWQQFIREERLAATANSTENMERVSKLASVIEKLNQTVDRRLDEMLTVVSRRQSGEERRGQKKPEDW